MTPSSTAKRPLFTRHLTQSPLLCVLLVCMWCVQACGGKQKTDEVAYVPPGQTGCKVGEFVLKGIDVIDEEDLLEGLATREDPGWRTGKFVQKIPVLGADSSYYNSVQLERDIERILTFYKMQGYFNAQVVSRSITKCQGNNPVTIALTIDEGVPTGVEKIDIEGLEQLPGILQLIRKRLRLSKDDIFTQLDYQADKSIIERVLKERSYAYARVRGRVIVNPKARTAAITYFVDAGPSSLFETPTIEGLDRVDEDYVREAITFEAGEGYSSVALQTTQEQLYDLGVFSLVTVQPDFQTLESRQAPSEQGIELSEDISSEEAEELGALGISDLLERAQTDAASRSKLSRRVPINIKVKEAKVWTGRVGAGFSINSTRQDVHGAFNVTSRNFLGKLGKLEQFNTVGYALTPGLLQVLERRAEDSDLQLDDFGNRGVFFNSLLRYSQPQLFERLLTGFIQAKVTRDIQENYIGLIPSATVGLRRQLFIRELQLEASYNVLFIRYQNFPDDFARELRAQGLDPRSNNGRPSLLLEYLEQKIIYDGRDSPINPMSGIRTQLSMQEARNYVVGGEYRYLKPQFEIDGYVPFAKKRFVTAARFARGAIYNTNPDAGDTTLGIPLQSRLYGGGKGSMRSFGPRYFGFFTDDLVDPGPIGSTTLLEMSIEQRFRLKRSFFDVGDLWAAAFLDSGSFSNQQLFFDTDANAFGTLGPDGLTSTLIHGLGGGIYWLTPVGPLRADLAITLTNLNNDPRFGLDPNVQDDPNTIGNEAILEQRYSEARLNKIRGFDFYLGIGHSF